MPALTGDTRPLSVEFVAREADGRNIDEEDGGRRRTRSASPYRGRPRSRSPSYEPRRSPRRSPSPLRHAPSRAFRPALILCSTLHWLPRTASLFLQACSWLPSRPLSRPPGITAGSRVLLIRMWGLQSFLGHVGHALTNCLISGCGCLMIHNR